MGENIEDGLSEQAAEQMAFEWFAIAHPHEAYAKWPERFWEFFKSKRPEVSREAMELALAETEEFPKEVAK